MSTRIDPAGAPVRVAVCISHPVSYFCALYAEAAADPALELEVVFAVRTGADPYVDAEFGVLVDTALAPVLRRFRHRFLSDATDLEAERRVPVRRILATLDAIDPEVVVIYGFHRRISRAALLWARRRRRPVAYISDSEDRGLRATRTGVAAMKRVAAAAVLRGVDRLLAVGDANEAFYRRRWVPTDRIVRVPFPIDRTAFADPDGGLTRAAAALRIRHGLDAVQVVLVSGKLVARKRPGDLVAALARSVHRTTTALVLVGDGPERRRLESEAARLGVRLLVTGFVAPADVPVWYRLADVYAHVAEFDPHPLAVSEAVHVGLPIILGDRTGSWGPDDDVVPGENGLVVPTGDVAAITAALDRLLGDPAERARMAAASAQRGLRLQAAAHRGFVEELVGLARPAQARRP